MISKFSIAMKSKLCYCINHINLLGINSEYIISYPEKWRDWPFEASAAEQIGCPI